MKHLIICFLIPTFLSFSTNKFSFVEFNKYSFQDFKTQNNVQFELNKIFKKKKKKDFFAENKVGNLLNKFSKTNHLSLKIKRSDKRENELKFSFSKSSLAIKYVLD